MSQLAKVLAGPVIIYTGKVESREQTQAILAQQGQYCLQVVLYTHGDLQKNCWQRIYLVKCSSKLVAVPTLALSGNMIFRARDYLPTGA
jgi:hypothetical protein